MPRIFFVTGSSTGIGKCYVQQILNSGDYVIATARKPETLSFDNANSTNFRAVYLDLTDAESVQNAFLVGLAKFGRIDVVVNNGGYGLSGPFEDLKDSEIKRIMDTNFTGVMVATRLAIKIFREQSPPGGLIQQVTSVLGRVTTPYLSLYNASKFAVEGFTETVAQEMDPAWNIKFVCMELGGFRTDFWPRSMTYTNAPGSAYDLEKIKVHLKGLHDAERGDPPKGARALYEVAVMENPPPKVVLGVDAFEWLNGHYKELHANLLKGEALSRSTSVDA